MSSLLLYVWMLTNPAQPAHDWKLADSGVTMVATFQTIPGDIHIYKSSFVCRETETEWICSQK